MEIHDCVGECERHDPGKPGWMWTHSGVRFWSLDPRPCDVRIGDIAHHLSLLCRYNGSVSRHYSVAEHCVRVSQEVWRVTAGGNWPNAGMLTLQGLMHDAAEAYLADLQRNVKRADGLCDVWGPIEARVHEAICRALGIPAEHPDVVKRADDALALTEIRDLFAVRRPPLASYTMRVSPLPAPIEPMSQEEAELAFLARYKALRS